MVWDVLFAVLLFCSHGLSMSCDQIAGSYEDNNHNLCLVMGSEYTGNISQEYAPTAADIKMFPNESAGTLEVQFPLGPSSEFNVYDLTLYIKEHEENEQECKSFRSHSENHKHSVQKFNISSCKDLADPTICPSRCTKTGSVTFRLIYTGCYYVHIQPSRNYQGLDYRSNPFSSNSVVLQTTYKKQTVWEMPPLISPQCLPARNEIRVNIKHEFLQEIPMVIKLREKVDDSEENTCRTTGNDHSCCVVSMKTGQFKCEREKMSPSIPVCDVLSGGNSVECTFSDMKPGNYCVTLEPKDEYRCIGRNVFTVKNDELKTCRYQTEIFPCNHVETVDSPNPTIPSPRSNTNTLIVVGAAVACVLIACIVYIALRHFRALPGPVLIPPSPPEIVLLQPKVLLLYAQDCEPFMKLMTTFRRLLTNLGKCEVLDCYDPARGEEVSSSPHEWMCHWASNPEVRVVVVTSDCAVAHQRAMSTSFSLQYWEPLPFNQLFLLGLKEVTYNHKKKEYLNTFVVRFDDTDLSYLTPYTRFQLPHHLEDLLKNLNPGVDITTLGEYKDEQKLRDDHKDLMIFKQQNPKYIVNLMTKSKEVV